MYFNVNFNVFFKLIKMYLLVSEFYTNVRNLSPVRSVTQWLIQAVPRRSLPSSYGFTIRAHIRLNMRP